MNLVNRNKKIWYPGIFPDHDIQKSFEGVGVQSTFCSHILQWQIMNQFVELCITIPIKCVIKPRFTVYQQLYKFNFKSDWISKKLWYLILRIQLIIKYYASLRIFYFLWNLFSNSCRIQEMKLTIGRLQQTY